jgi:hypothetical protein
LLPAGPPWQAAFTGGGNNGGTLAGVINGQEVLIEPYSSNPSTCPFAVVGRRSGNTISGTYAAFNCTINCHGIRQRHQAVVEYIHRTFRPQAYLGPECARLPELAPPWANALGEGSWRVRPPKVPAGSLRP